VEFLETLVKQNAQSYKALGWFVKAFLEVVQVGGAKELVKYIQRGAQKNT
jgi:hypothetical protein